MDIREKATRDLKEEETKPNTTCDGELVAELLSELHQLTDDDDDESKHMVKVEKMSPPPPPPSSSSETNEKIMREVKNIKRQNTITHYLLTASILLTLAWQLSEFSLTLKIKQGFTNPLQSIGGALKGLFTSRSQENNGNQDASHIIPPTYLPGIKIPDLSYLNLPGFDTTSDDEDD